MAKTKRQVSVNTLQEAADLRFWQDALAEITPDGGNGQQRAEYAEKIRMARASLASAVLADLWQDIDELLVERARRAS